MTILDPTKSDTAQADHDIDAYGAHLRHALRTPLNAVVGFTEMLLESVEEKGDGEFISDLRKIDSSAQRFLSLINDVVNFARVQAGERPEGEASETLSIGQGCRENHPSDGGRFRYPNIGWWRSPDR